MPNIWISRIRLDRIRCIFRIPRRYLKLNQSNRIHTFSQRQKAINKVGKTQRQWQEMCLKCRTNLEDTKKNQGHGGRDSKYGMIMVQPHSAFDYSRWRLQRLDCISRKTKKFTGSPQKRLVNDIRPATSEQEWRRQVKNLSNQGRRNSSSG